MTIPGVSELYSKILPSIPLKKACMRSQSPAVEVSLYPNGKMQKACKRVTISFYLYILDSYPINLCSIQFLVEGFFILSVYFYLHIETYIVYEDSWLTTIKDLLRDSFHQNGEIVYILS